MRLPIALIVLGALAFGAAVAAQRTDAFVASRDHAAIAYSKTPVSDPVSALNRQLVAGTARLTFDPVSGYLRSVLDALNVPIESQTLVFSPTSFQASLVSMHNPRALYFNDTVAVGWVRGAVLPEHDAAVDPSIAASDARDPACHRIPRRARY